MFLRTLIVTIILTVVSAAPALAEGGQDILIDYPHARIGRCVDVAVSEDGTLFATSASDSLETAVNVYRSTNGGSTWQLWSQLTTSYADGHLYAAQMAMVSGSPGKVLVALIDRRLDVEESNIRITTAPADAATPAWTDVSVHTTSNHDPTLPRIDSFALLGIFDRICLVWKEFLDVMYVTSDDSGLTWSTPIELGSATDNIRDLDVAADNQNRVHASWITQEFATGTCTVHYRRADMGGVNLPNWNTTQVLRQDNRIFLRVTMAANPDFLSESVMVAVGTGYSTEPTMWVLDSTDGGVSWDTSSYPNFTEPEAVWNLSGRIIAAAATESSYVGDSIAALYPDPGGWSAEAMIDNAGFVSIGNAHIVIDPTRDNDPVMVQLRRNTWDPVSEGAGLWFDAGWRGYFGYGVPDPGGAPTWYSGDVSGALIAGHIDDNENLDLIFTTDSAGSGQVMSRYEPATGTASNLFYNMDPDTDFALVDLEYDESYEVALLRDDFQLCVIRGLNTFLSGYPRDLGLMGSAWISGARVTGREKDDVVVAGGNTVWVVGEDAIDRPGWPWIAPPAAGQTNGRVALGDVDADGQMELVAPFTGGLVILGPDGQLEIIIGQGEAEPGNPSLTDFDDDGDLEIVIPRADGTVHVVHHDGTPVDTRWPYDTGAAGLPSQVALADFVGDDRRDLVFMDAARMVHIVRPAGLGPAGWPRQVDPATPLMEPIVAKLGLGDPVVAVGGADGRVQLLRPTGPLEGWPRDYRDPVITSLVAANMDDDIYIELGMASGRTVSTLDMGVALNESLKEWTMSGFDPGRSGCTEPYTGSMSNTPQAQTAAVQLHPAAPNPFNPTTHIRFSLPADAEQVTLRVFDAAGRRVRTLHQGALPAGDHTVAWRGDDDGGRAVASGVYFSRLESGGQAQTKPMVLVR